MESLFSPDSKLQTAQGKELVGFLMNDLFKPMQRYREPKDYDWLNFDAYYENNCWYVINKKTGSMSPIPVAEWRDKISIPETFIAHRAIKSLILNKDPTYTVMPTTNDEFFDPNKGAVYDQASGAHVGAWVDGPIMEATKISSRYLEYYEDECHLKLKRDELVDDGLRIGNGYWKFGYDPSLKDGLGETTVERISPYWAFLDWQTRNAKTLDGCRFLCVARPMSTDEIKDRWGVEVDSDNKLSVSMFEERSIQDGMSGSAKAKGTRIVYEFEIKEPLHHLIDDTGAKITTEIIRVIICTDNELLSDMYDPLGINMFSLRAMQYNAKPGQIYADGNIRHQMQIKEQIDKRLSHMVDSTKRMSLPRLIVGKDSIDLDDLNDEPGAVIMVDETASKIVPQVLQGSSVSKDVGYVIDYHEKKLADVVGLHDVSKGNIPQGITSGRQLELAQAADTQVLGPYIKELERFMSEAAKVILKIMQSKYTAERIFSYLDKENGQTDGTFDPKQLDFSQVRVEISSYLANTRAARQDILLQLFQAGAIGPETIVRGYEFPDISKVMEDLRSNANLIPAAQKQKAGMALQGGQQGPPSQGAPASAGVGLVAPQQNPGFH